MSKWGKIKELNIWFIPFYKSIMENEKNTSYRVNVYSMLQWYTILLKDAYAPLVGKYTI